VTIAQVAGAARALPAAGEPIRWGTALDWGMTLTLVLSALILAGIVVSLVVFRGRQTEGNALWFHLLTLGIFPLFLIVIGNFSVIEYAKDVRFCGGCHVPMQPYVDDLHNRKSDSLAAAHYLQRSAPGSECYLCHADYGVHGTLVAKLSGLKDVYRLVTHTYPNPIKMYAPFSNELCLKCHNGAKAFMAQGIHLDDDGKVSADLLTQDTDCTQCHGPAHELPKAKRAMRQAEAR
jgi:nitrate/TMAO reductase-like tetraheme cytochrome c subunit